MSNREMNTAQIVLTTLGCLLFIAASHGQAEELSWDPGNAGSHWAYQPIQPPRVPEVGAKNRTWSPIDDFLLSEMEKQGLQPNPVADRYTLIRRVTFDLTGLPPTPFEIREFLEDPSPDRAAFARLVDRLLASPHYGERQGRRWMDLVRYADTAGDNSDYPVPQLHLYRDYIIASFNEDKPFARFVTEQIAGDLMEATDPESSRIQRIATGYIASARRFGSVVDRYPTHLTIEDTLDNLGRTFLGLTLTCARCHDHKFEAISTADYYGLYGIFASTRYAFPGIELLKVQKDFVPLVAPEEMESMMQPFRAKERQLQQRHDELVARRVSIEKEKQALNDGLTALSGPEKENGYARLHQLDADIDKLRKDIRNAAGAIEQHKKSAPQIPNAYGVLEGQPADAAIQIKGEPDKAGPVVPRKFLDILGGTKLNPDPKQSGRLELAQWITDPANPLTPRVLVNRIWHQHFGRGLVPSLNNFGERGESPTHPELLDWLASEFLSSGGSFKAMHRLILNSRAYQLSSLDSDANLTIDPANQGYWRANRRRLEAEELRDALLMISGTLDLRPPNGPHPFPPMEKWQFTQHHPFKDEYTTSRRSVYQMTKRLTVEPFWQTFDGPDRNANTPERGQSVTSLQALYLLNDSEVHEHAGHFAKRIQEAGHTDRERLDAGFLMALGRPPSEAERERILTFLDTSKSEAWSTLARVLFRMNAFLHVD